MPQLPGPANPCLAAGAQAQQAKAKCGLLRGHPFSACHNHVKVNSGFIQDCEYDVCACKDNPVSCLCEEYDAYATMCRYAGVNIAWKHLAQFSQCGKHTIVLHRGGLKHDGTLHVSVLMQQNNPVLAFGR